MKTIIFKIFIGILLFLALFWIDYFAFGGNLLWISIKQSLLEFWEIIKVILYLIMICIAVTFCAAFYICKEPL